MTRITKPMCRPPLRSVCQQNRSQFGSRSNRSNWFYKL